MHRTVCDFALDLVQNSIEADSSLVVLDVHETNAEITFYLSDNGKGMDEEELEAAQNPFYTSGTKHKGRDVGLGIPFLAQTVEMAGGSFDISSEKGVGTSATFTFRTDNIDTPPKGNLPDLFFAALTYPGDFEMVIHRKFSVSTGGPPAVQMDGHSFGRAFTYSVERSSLLNALGSFEEVGALSLLRDYLKGMEIPEREGTETEEKAEAERLAPKN